MKYYLAYGSNLSVSQMIHRCPTATYVGKTWIKDHRLLFRGSMTGNYLTIEPMEGREVPALIWRIEKEDEGRLDIYEGYPNFYTKENLLVTAWDLLASSPVDLVDAMVYTMTGHRPKGSPTKSYFRVCLEGYERFGFDKKILYTALEESTEG